ncbi:MAG TPA: ABC transporter permease subunit [Pseudonocardiaceae bacterium]|jgi:ABC-type transport system involved in multi-copper enzyme maturation permease subunit|nr:ABC transporter permease subunit [Pseudonocardiaceae bacterium]
MTATTAYRSGLAPGRTGFGQLLRAEWTKFRTVLGWVIGALVAVGVTVLIGLLGPLATTFSCGDQQTTCKQPVPPTGPAGEPVTDAFYFVHQPLTGDGGITAHITSLTGEYPSQGTRPANQGPDAGLAHGTQPWSKAGIILKQNLRQGSHYAAVALTGGNGVRMQYDYTHDTAGSATARWLRLTRSGDTLTGYDSADGTHWTEIGTARLALPDTVQIGLFATSPQYTVTTQSFGGSTARGGPSVATGTFADIDVRGGTGGWTGTELAGSRHGDGGGPPTGYQPTADGFTVTGSGDIAPLPAGLGSGHTVADSLVGAFAGLIAMIVVATMFVTAEYRRGLIGTTFTASPRRGRVLAAKSVVAGSVGLGVGLVAAAIAVPVIAAVVRAKGLYSYPLPFATDVRIVVGVAAVLAVVAVLAVAVGTVLRRGAGAVTAVIVVIVLPYLLSVASPLPESAGEWLLRLTPAAAFAVEQATPAYPQVTSVYNPAGGYFPLPPWAGFLVLCGYTAVVLALAAVLVRRRDA